MLYYLFSIFMINLVEGVFVPSDESNLVYFDLLKKSFNEGNAAQIYNLFSEDTQKAISLEIFSSQIEAIRNRQGNISYWAYSTVEQKEPSLLLGFQKHLGTGIIQIYFQNNTLFWSYDQKGKIASFRMNDHLQPSMVQWIKHYCQPKKIQFSEQQNFNFQKIEKKDCFIYQNYGRIKLNLNKPQLVYYFQQHKLIQKILVYNLNIIFEFKFLKYNILINSLFLLLQMIIQQQTTLVQENKL